MDTSELPVSKFSEHTIVENHSALPPPTSEKGQAITKLSNYSLEKLDVVDLQNQNTQIDTPYVHDNFQNVELPLDETNSMRSSPSAVIDYTKNAHNKHLHSNLKYNNSTLEQPLTNSYKPIIDPISTRQYPSTISTSIEREKLNVDVHENQKEYTYKNEGDAIVVTTKYCPPSKLGSMSWNQTESNTYGKTSCPQYSNGFAYRYCDPGGHWKGKSADLSQCKSEWLNQIIASLDTRDQQLSIVHLSNMMAEYVIRNQFHGGDILHLISIMERLIDALRVDLELIPTASQREAVITQVVQNIIKTGSVMLEEENHSTWRDLGHVSRQLETLSAFVISLENAGLLLPEGAGENKEVTIASENIRK